MSVFDLDERGARDLEEQARLNPLDISEVDPGFWDNAVKGTGMGLMRGGARVGQFLGLAAAAQASVYERVTGQEGKYTDPYFRAMDDTVGSAVDHWTPAAHEVGTAGRVLGGFGEMALPLAAGAGNPSLLIGSQTLPTGADLVREGVDPTTAAAVGLVQGAATAVGFRLPYLGKTFASRMLSGTVGNLLTNAGATAAQRAALQLGGYDELADQYDPLDFEARAIDILTGIAFGGLAHLQMRGSDRAAVAAAANAKHLQADTAPGKPLDAAAYGAHQQAIEQAVGSILRGEPVVPPAEMATANFEPVARQPVEVPQELRDFDAARIDDEINTRLDADEQRLQRLVEGPDSAAERLTLTLPDVDRQIQDVTKLRDEAAAVLSKDMGEMVRQEAQQLARADAANRYAQDRTRESGGGADDAVFPQLQQQAEQTVARQRTQAQEQLTKANDLLADLRTRMDRATAIRGAEIDLEALRYARKTATTTRERLELMPERLRQMLGQRLDEAEARIAVRPAPEPGKPAAAKPAKPSAKSSQGAKAADPIVTAARDAALKGDIRVPTGDIDAEGNAVTTTAAELLARSDAEIQKAQADAVGFEAAVNCFLSTGAQ